MAKDFVLEEDEIIIKTVRGDYWKDIRKFSGRYTFTNKRIRFEAISLINFSLNIYYNDITSYKPINLLIVMPTGLRIVEQNGSKKHNLSLLSRKPYLEILNEYVTYNNL